MNTGEVRTWLTDRGNWLKIILPLLLIAALFIAGRLIEVDKYLQDVQQWVRSFGKWGPVVYTLIYVGAMLLLLPGTPFTVLAAFLFGFAWGFFTMVVATTLAASAAFLIARYLARRAVEERLAGTETFRKLRAMVEKNRRIAIPFVRLMPFFPFAINNYALGLTRISFWSYLLWSEVVFLPMNAVLILGAGAIYRALVLGEVSWWLIGLTVGAGLLVLAIGIAAKRALGDTATDPEEG